jgi:hypothetical protein
MEPHRGGSTGRKMKKVSPEDLFGWLDEERFIDVKQPKKRRSTSAPPPPPTGRKTHVKTKNSKKSSEVAAGKELKRASKRCNASLNDTISRGPSAAVTNQSKTRRGRSRREKRQQQQQQQQQQQRKSSSFTGTTFCISDLPSESLIHVASFLAKPSQALFAAALQGLDKKPGEGIISGNQWDVLEFGEIEKALTVKLTDDHISAVLLCIGPSKVKKLRLTNLVNITGVGLQPLCGSLTVEQIDFSIVGEYKSPVIDADGNRINKELPLSCDNVLPILDSIIEREGCALKHLQFPKVWREKWLKDASVYSHYNIPGDLTGKYDFYRFLHRYNNVLRCRGRRPCDKCNEDHRYCNGVPLIETSRGLHDKYIQQHTCYECLKQCCTNCAHRCGAICERYYCSDCRYDTCENCGTEGICKGCKVFIDCLALLFTAGNSIFGR